MEVFAAGALYLSACLSAGTGIFAKLGCGTGDSDVISRRSEKKLQANPIAYITSLFFGRTGAATPEKRLPVERNRKIPRQKQAMLLGGRSPRGDRPRPSLSQTDLCRIRCWRHAASGRSGFHRHMSAVNLFCACAAFFLLREITIWVTAQWSFDAKGKLSVSS